jgi:hypothetical protein
LASRNGVPTRRRADVPTRRRLSVLVVVFFALGCGHAPTRASDAGASADAGVSVDAGLDAGTSTDAGAGDAGAGDAGADAGVDAGMTCAWFVDAGTPFGELAMLSPEDGGAFSPSVAARDGEALVVWHQFDEGARTHLALVHIAQGCVGPVQTLAEPLGDPKRPSLAATASGYALAYEATDPSGIVIRAVDLAPDGTIASGPITLTTAGETGEMARVAAQGDQVAYAWTDGNGLFFALRGPDESVGATPLAVTVQQTGLLTNPRIALAPDGTLYLTYRDGPQASDNEVYVLTRPKGGAFGAAVNVSQSVGLDSDDPAIAVRDDGSVDLAWAEEDPVQVQNFEAVHAHLDASGWSAPALYGAQGGQVRAPALLPGLAAAWNLGGSGLGPFYWDDGSGAPVAIFPSVSGNAAALARGPDGATHLALVENAQPRHVRYAWSR